MAKRTAIIDIGSNSARLVIFQKTSTHGFHLICEQKSRVRIGEGAYENSGNLQKIGIDRAFSALQSFSQTIKEFKTIKVICVATSALRDAPNRNIFIKRVKDRLGIEIKVIDGQEEALYGAIAANNLLPISDGITIDIGGGSSDISLIKKNKIVATHSLNLGTVRLKELFFDKNASEDKIHSYIQNELKLLPEKFHSHTAIGIGGTIRTLAKAIMKKTDYPLNKLHAFRYDIHEHIAFFKQISNAKPNDLSKLRIKEDRHDTIREGVSIFIEILKKIGAKKVITSGVGVRDGVYLHSKLKNSHLLPNSSNPSLRSIKDRFDILDLPHGNKKDIAKKLYNIFKDRLRDDTDYLPSINKALSLSDIGKMLTIYQQNKHAYYISMQELNYGFEHEEMVLISLLLYSKGDRAYPKELYRKYKKLLPQKSTFKWLCFIYTMTILLHRNSANANIKFIISDNYLNIISDRELYLAREDINSMKKPNSIEIGFKS